jgi:hypothetical protein
MIKGLLFLCWFMLQALFIGGCGGAALGLAVFWFLGIQRRFNHELSWGWLEFTKASALIWFVVIGYVVAVRTWWPYAKRTLRAVTKPATPRLPDQ